MMCKPIPSNVLAFGFPYLCDFIDVDNLGATNEGKGAIAPPQFLAYLVV